MRDGRGAHRLTQRLASGQTITAPAPLKPVAATASSVHAPYEAKLAIDGVISDSSRWVSETVSGPAWLEVQLAATSKLAGRLYYHVWHRYPDEAPRPAL